MLCINTPSPTAAIRKPSRPIKTYFFWAPSHGWQPQLTISSFAHGKLIRRDVEPTEATYRRFVRLANTGKYAVAIAEEDSVSWELRRQP